jgi:hypothetical protein
VDETVCAENTSVLEVLSGEMPSHHVKEKTHLAERTFHCKKMLLMFHAVHSRIAPFIGLSLALRILAMPGQWLT